MNINKDDLYNFLTDEPDKQKFAEFLKSNGYEGNDIDFKEQWIKKGKLAKIILAMANYGGGIIVFGVKENSDGLMEPVGIEKIRDQADVSNELKKYLPEHLFWKVQNFSYEKSEYEKLNGKTFQILIIYDTPKYLPFISRSYGEDGLKESAIYTRRGTESVEVNNSELQDLISRRIETHFVSNIDFSEHMKQLKVLYSYKPQYPKIFNITFTQSNVEFDDYIDYLIKKKKKIIESVLGL